MAYVYRHIRLDTNVPFYIGISKKDDADYSRANQFKRKFRSERWCHVYNKTPIEVEILFDGVPFDFAKEKEKEFIKLYGRKEDGGTLMNLTLGGDGKSGIPNPSLSKYRYNWVGRKHRPESRDRIAKSNMGKKHTLESKERMSLAAQKRTGNKNSNYRGAVYAYLNGSLVSIFDSVRDASEKLYMDAGIISSIINLKRVSNRGYIFQRQPSLFTDRKSRPSPNRVYKTKNND